ncbi:hypothetical protein [Streptomyces tremellae]|uniref:Uncharacterized protein n=1 Tax=Streptomyces tremellae TaxID=1124239 RepID=A0ABP7EKG5_9ACTN
MDRPVNRIERNLLAAVAYQTYSIRQPRDTAVVTACEQAGCEQWARGWDTPVDESTELGRQQAAYIRGQSRRTFRELRAQGGVTVFRFEPGQRCFREHRTRPQLFAVRDGDYRGNPTGRVRQHSRPQDWVEDFGEHQLALTDQQRKG